MSIEKNIVLTSGATTFVSFITGAGFNAVSSHYANLSRIEGSSLVSAQSSYEFWKTHPEKFSEGMAAGPKLEAHIKMLEANTASYAEASAAMENIADWADKIAGVAAVIAILGVVAIGYRSRSASR